MSNVHQSEPDSSTFGELAGGYSIQLPRKLKLLLPFKDHIEGLLAKHATYDDIRELLKQANIVVSKNTVYRFCRDVIGQRPVRQTAPEKIQAPKTVPVLPTTANPPANVSASIQTALQERRERLPGLWGRRKRGPRIADSKNL